MTETQTIIQRQDPAIEAYRLGLLRDAQSLIADRVASGELPPDYQVAQLAPSEQTAIATALQNVGGYAPFLSAGAEMIGQGQQLLAGQAAPALQQAIGAAGAGQQFINQASQLAAAQRALPFQSQAAANQMLQQGLGLGTQQGQQGIAQLLGSIDAGQQAALLGSTALSGTAAAHLCPCRRGAQRTGEQQLCMVVAAKVYRWSGARSSYTVCSTRSPLRPKRRSATVIFISRNLSPPCGILKPRFCVILTVIPWLLVCVTAASSVITRS